MSVYSPDAPPVSADLVDPAPHRSSRRSMIELGPRSERHSLTNGRWSRVLIRFVGPLLLIAIWQLASSLGLISVRLLPSPAIVLEALRGLIRTGELQAALAVSLRRAGLGLAIGTVVGVSFGLLSGLAKLGEQLLDSSLQMLRTIPFIALTPLFLVWFGIGEQPKVALVAAACIFPNYLYTYSGVRNIDTKLLEAGDVFRLSRFAQVKRIILPTALPSILMGIRYSMGVSLLALVAAEQINAMTGIGHILMTAAVNDFRADIIIAGIVVYALLGIAVDLIIRGLEHVLLPWSSSAVHR